MVIFVWLIYHLPKCRNLEDELKVKHLGSLFLIFFSDYFLLNRAQTAQAKTQVSIGKIQLFTVRELTNMWDHLEPAASGTTPEWDPVKRKFDRIARYPNRITLLKEKLLEIEKQGETQRKVEKYRSVWPSLAYQCRANTLMNLITRQIFWRKISFCHSGF